MTLSEFMGDPCSRQIILTLLGREGNQGTPKLLLIIIPGRSICALEQLKANYIMWMLAKSLLLIKDERLISCWLRVFFIKYNGPPNLIFTLVIDLPLVKYYSTSHLGKIIEFLNSSVGLVYLVLFGLSAVPHLFPKGLQVVHRLKYTK